MFRTLRTAFDRRKQDIEAQSRIHTKVQEILSQYGTALHISYDIYEGLLKIQAPSKTVASELLLKSGEIGALLRQEGITVQQIIIH